MIQLCAAWRKISVSRTTGTAPRRDDVGQHLTRPDRRQLVDVADEDSAARRRHRLQDRRHQRHVHHRRLVDDQQVARRAGSSSSRRKPPVFGSNSSSRWIVFASRPVALGQPLGRPARGRRTAATLDALGAAGSQDGVDQGRLADPGPAGDDQHLGRAAPGAAPLLAGRRASRPICSSTQAMAFVGVDGAARVVEPRRSARQALGDGLSAWRRLAQEDTVGSSVDRLGHDHAFRRLELERPRRSIARGSPGAASGRASAARRAAGRNGRRPTASSRA